MSICVNLKSIEVHPELHWCPTPLLPDNEWYLEVNVDWRTISSSKFHTLGVLGIGRQPRNRRNRQPSYIRLSFHVVSLALSIDSFTYARSRLHEKSTAIQFKVSFAPRWFRGLYEFKTDISYGITLGSSSFTYCITNDTLKRKLFPKWTETWFLLSSLRRIGNQCG